MSRDWGGTDRNESIIDYQRDEARYEQRRAEATGEADVHPLDCWCPVCVHEQALDDRAAS